MKKKAIINSLLLSSLIIGSTQVLAAPGDVETKERKTEGVITFEPNDEPIGPTDPINPGEPGQPIDPEDPEKPVEPGTPGPLSLDFASSFNFGKQKITSENKVYMAKPQAFKVEDGSIEERPLYAQVTDGRGELKGWSLSLKQNGQFKGKINKKELNGAEIKFVNGQTSTEMESGSPSTVSKNVELVATGSAASLLMEAKAGEAAGTHIYHLGDLKTMSESVQLHVPGKATKLKDTYETTLTWQLSTLPANGEGPSEPGIEE
ncbi:WxL domain-containing protein [Vagococcus salmoninarum]|uniref:WxL domain-containing protein n=1 Tax=Vagococcus salmoninarum TaxID=2739 RepID=A0A429ZHL3_9ENTE|nr:WxL domain-containing protein [Vagococcus salmoninarum]RST93200.1 hypothetical protein CBF35_12060 [Vagococcus salmoninarum]